MRDEGEPLEMTSAAAPVEDPHAYKRKPRGRRLHSLRHIRTMLAATLRRLEAWPDAELRPADRIAKSRTLIYGASVMGELVKSAEVEERLRLVEELVRSGRH